MTIIELPLYDDDIDSICLIIEKIKYNPSKGHGNNKE